MSSIKTYIIGIVIILILGLIGYSLYTTNKIKKYKAKYNTEYANRKALEAENDSISNNAELLKYTISDIKNSNDSLFQEIYKVKKQLKIKDKNITQLQYMLSTAEKTDSIVYRDTLFVSPDIKIDTTIGDKWINTRLRLEYPSSIFITPSVRSEKFIIMNKASKFIEKPSKIFFIRWFQKKYTTVDIGVVEKNPYIHSETNRFIEVIK